MKKLLFAGCAGTVIFAATVVASAAQDLTKSAAEKLAIASIAAEHCPGHAGNPKIVTSLIALLPSDFQERDTLIAVQKGKMAINMIGYPKAVICDELVKAYGPNGTESPGLLQ